MGRDKGSLVYRDGLDQRTRCYRILRSLCNSVWISCRREQATPEGLPRIEDSLPGEGPGVGILSALATDADPSTAWLVIACDFPNAGLAEVRRLVFARRREKAATVYVGESGILEPLFAIWEPAALAALKEGFTQGKQSPREALESLDCERVAATGPGALLNANSPLDLA
jgi:molybdopterin-guanine dinucleotide biosynthesis protein A